MILHKNYRKSNEDRKREIRWYWAEIVQAQTLANITFLLIFLKYFLIKKKKQECNHPAIF
jgi:hypothetical protein